MYRAILFVAALAALAPSASAAKTGRDPIIVTTQVHEMRVSLVGKDMAAIKRDVRDAADLVCADAQFWPELSSPQARTWCSRGSYDQAMTEVRLHAVRAPTYAALDWIRVAAIDPRTGR